MSTLEARVIELAARGYRDLAITTALKPSFPDLTRHRVRVIIGEGSKPQTEIQVATHPPLIDWQLPTGKPPVYQGGASVEEHADAWETVDRRNNTC